VGVARIERAAYADPTAKGEDWSVVDVAPHGKLAKPVPLEAMKKDPKLKGFALITKSRLSVVPVSKEHFEHIVRVGETKLA
jgi:predicted RNA-binding protein with PUA-like domain